LAILSDFAGWIRKRRYLLLCSSGKCLKGLRDQVDGSPLATPSSLAQGTPNDRISNNRDSCWLEGDGLKIRVPMQPLMECVIAKTISRGLRSQAGTYFVRSQMKRRML
jgi:hypothetical protein